MADRKGFVVGFGEAASTTVLAGQAMRGQRRTPTRRKRRASTTTRRRKKKRAAPVRKRRTKRKAARLVKGSVAAKRHMAKLRRMRRR